MKPPAQAGLQCEAAALNTELAQLQYHAESLPSSAQRTAIHQHLGALLALCEALQIMTACTVFAISAADEGLEGLLDLLHQAQSQPLGAHHLANLLTPWQALGALSARATLILGL